MLCLGLWRDWVLFLYLAVADVLCMGVEFDRISYSPVGEATVLTVKGALSELLLEHRFTFTQVFGRALCFSSFWRFNCTLS